MTALDPRAWLDQVDARTNAATDGPWVRDRTYPLGHPGPYSIAPGDDLRWDSASIVAEHDGPHALLFVPGRDLVQEAFDEGYQSGQDDAEYATQTDRDEAL